MNAKLQQYFLAILSKQDYSESNLQQKGVQKGYENADIVEVITWLKQLNYVNDRRYTEQLLLRYEGQKGGQWLNQKLRMKGISSQLISEIMQQQKYTVADKLKRAIEEKYHIETWKSADFATIQKAAAFLARRGFSNAWEIIQQWKNDDL